MIFLIILGLVIVGDLILLFNDEYGWSIALMGLTLIVGNYVSPDIHAFITSHGWKTILAQYVPIYIGIGVGVALLKWIILNLKVASFIKENKTDPQNKVISRQDFLQRWNDAARAWDTRSTISYIHQTKYLIEDDELFLDAITPKAKKHIVKITTWILQWPIVLVATLFNDVLRKFGKWIATLFDKLFNRLSRWLIQDAAKGL